MDRKTKWYQVYPVVDKIAAEAESSLRRFLGPNRRAKYAYHDGSKELDSAVPKISKDHDKSTPNRPETNGVIERCVRRAKEGASCLLVHAGLDEAW